MKRRKSHPESVIAALAINHWLENPEFQAGIKVYIPPRLLVEIDGSSYYLDTAFVMRYHLNADMVPGELNYWQKNTTERRRVVKPKTTKGIAEEVLGAWMYELGDLHHKCCAQTTDENWAIKSCDRGAVLALEHNSRTTYVCLVHAPQIFMELMNATNNRIAELLSD